MIPRDFWRAFFDLAFHVAKKFVPTRSLVLFNNVCRENYNALLESLKCEAVKRCSAKSFISNFESCKNFCENLKHSYCEDHMVKYRKDCCNYHLYTNYRNWYYALEDRKKIEEKFPNFQERIDKLFDEEISGEKIAKSSVEKRLAYLAVKENVLRRRFSAEFFSSDLDKGRAEFCKFLWTKYSLYFKINLRGEILEQDCNHLDDQDYSYPYKYYQVHPPRYCETEEEEEETELPVSFEWLESRETDQLSNWDSDEGESVSSKKRKFDSEHEEKIDKKRLKI